MSDNGTRARILNAALDLFGQQGFAGTSIRALARRVGVRESSLYNHFAGKDAILLALIAEHGPAMSASRLESAPYRRLADDPSGFCALYARDLIAQWDDPREQRFQELITSERNRSAELRRRYFDQLFGREQTLVTRYFEGFASADLVATNDVRETSRLFMAGLTYIRLENYTIPAKPSPRAQVERAVAKYLHNFLALAGVQDGAAQKQTIRMGGRHGQIAARRAASRNR